MQRSDEARDPTESSSRSASDLKSVLGTKRPHGTYQSTPDRYAFRDGRQYRSVLTCSCSSPWAPPDRSLAEPVVASSAPDPRSTVEDVPESAKSHMVDSIYIAGLQSFQRLRSQIQFHFPPNGRYFQAGVSTKNSMPAGCHTTCLTERSRSRSTSRCQVQETLVIVLCASCSRDNIIMVIVGGGIDYGQQASAKRYIDQGHQSRK